MNRITPLLLVATGILAFATLMLVILPGWQVRTIEPPKALSPYTLEQLSGRQQYIANGCVYCHSQQPRSTGQTFADLARGWGRASTKPASSHRQHLNALLQPFTTMLAKSRATARTPPGSLPPRLPGTCPTATHSSPASDSAYT